MQVGHSGKTPVPNYSFVRGSQLYGTERRQSVGGRRIELVVLDSVFEALRPAGIEATPRAIEHATSDHDGRVRSAELELELAQIHAERARRQFDGCEPENRLVARTLEREWERLKETRRASIAGSTGPRSAEQWPPLAVAGFGKFARRAGLLSSKHGTPSAGCLDSERNRCTVRADLRFRAGSSAAGASRSSPARARTRPGAG
jgi:hypothetical protein